MKDFEVNVSNKHFILPFRRRCQDLANFCEVGLVNELVINLPITHKLFDVRFPYEVLSTINSFDYLSQSS